MEKFKHVKMTIEYDITKEGFNEQEFQDFLKEIGSGDMAKEMDKDMKEDGVFNSEMKIEII